MSQVRCEKNLTEEDASTDKREGKVGYDRMEGEKKRAVKLFLELKKIPVEDQSRKKLRKKYFSTAKIKQMEVLTKKLLSILTAEEEEDISVMNILVYVVVAVLSFKEGLEMSEKKAGNWSAKMKTEPKWKKRLDNKVLRMRRDVYYNGSMAGKKSQEYKDKRIHEAAAEWV